MSKEEKEKKAKEFWAYYMPTQGSLKFTPEFFLNDDCPVPEGLIVQTR